MCREKGRTCFARENSGLFSLEGFDVLDEGDLDVLGGHEMSGKVHILLLEHLAEGLVLCHLVLDLFELPLEVGQFCRDGLALLDGLDRRFSQAGDERLALF